MRKKYDFCLALELILTAFLVLMSGQRAAGQETAARIAPKILRFHVLANSDRPEDQALKLEVKDLLLDEIRENLAAERGEDDPPPSKEDICAYIKASRGELAALAEQYMNRRGYEYTAAVQLEQCYFPERTYGDMTFPAGTYDAVRVLIGEGEGRNFWCVLYPSLCYLDATHAVVPEESKELLQTLIPEDDFQSLMIARHPQMFFGQPQAKEKKLPKVHIKFKLASVFGKKE